MSYSISEYLPVQFLHTTDHFMDAESREGKRETFKNCWPFAGNAIPRIFCCSKIFNFFFPSDLCAALLYCFDKYPFQIWNQDLNLIPAVSCIQLLAL